MGFLSEGGYIDFIMAEENKEEEQAEKEAKKEKKKKAEEEGSNKEAAEPVKPAVEEQAESAASPEDGSKSEEAKKVKAKAEKKTVDTKDIENSIQSFQKFNGFPETGLLSQSTIFYSISYCTESGVQHMKCIV